MKVKKFVLGLMAAIFAVTFSSVAMAQGNIIVTPTTLQGWAEFTQAGGAVSFVKDGSAPGGNSAIQLTTNNTNEAVAQLGHTANTPLSGVTQLSYYTKQVGMSSSYAAPFYYLGVCLDGFTGTNCNGFTYLVYEAYLNGTVTNGIWQRWDVGSGKVWSAGSYSNGACNVTAGSGGSLLYNLSQIKASCGNAVVVEFGVGIGTYNPNYVVETDLISFNGTTYDFESRMRSNSK